MPQFVDDGPGRREVIDSLANRIRNGEFTDGVLPGVEVIASMYMCSYKTVRAALHELQEQGLINYPSGWSPITLAYKPPTVLTPDEWTEVVQLLGQYARIMARLDQLGVDPKTDARIFQRSLCSTGEEGPRKR